MFEEVWASNNSSRTVTSLDPSHKLSWGKGYTPEAVAGSYGTTFGGEGGSSKSPYGTGASQKAFDMAYFLNGKYSVHLKDNKHDL
mmetsp:Transcript_38599/g.77390  ORF Transcript_38599/g.77390 Transcript_38599/m.77390 type:complete len:85 (-) Transcript_38599:2-256(-)